jgi:hypothetical protein
MPYSYLIDTERRIVFSRIWGVLTDDEVIAHATGLRDDPRFEAGFNQVIDFRALTDMQLTTPGLRKLAHLNPFRSNALRAFVVATDEALALSKAFWTYTEAGVDGYTLFRSLEPAMEFVGLDPKTPWPNKPPDKSYGGS